MYFYKTIVNGIGLTGLLLYICLSVSLSVCLSVRMFTCLYLPFMISPPLIFLSNSVTPLVKVTQFPSLCRMDPEQTQINTCRLPPVKHITKKTTDYRARKLNQSDLSSRSHDQSNAIVGTDVITWRHPFTSSENKPNLFHCVKYNNLRMIHVKIDMDSIRTIENNKIATITAQSMRNKDHRTFTKAG